MKLQRLIKCTSPNFSPKETWCSESHHCCNASNNCPLQTLSSASLRSFFYLKLIILLFLSAEHVLHEHYKCQLSNPSPTSLPFPPHFRPSASNPPCALRWRMLISSSPFSKRPSTTTWKETAGRDVVHQCQQTKLKIIYRS